MGKKLQEEMADARRQLEETTQSMSQKMEAASEATAVAIEQNEVVEANGVDETSSEAESEREAELDITTHGEEEREMDAKKEDLLKELRANLEATKEEEKLTVEDRQYMKLAETGRDKFKTLRDIRSGNTKRRLDMFENM